jgi:hypothetical protein
VGQLNDLWTYKSSTSEWTWLSGSSTAYDFGVYDSSSNAMPSARSHCVLWYSRARNSILLYGGMLFFSFFSDLWEYDIQNNVWTWLKGDMDGTGYYGEMNVPSPLNNPPGRMIAVVWSDHETDSHYLFGGATGLDSLGDLWRYSDGNWTWIGGTTELNYLGNYIDYGVVNSSSLPHSRSGAAACVDGHNNVYLFGGTMGNNVESNDLGLHKRDLDMDFRNYWRCDGSIWRERNSVCNKHTQIQIQTFWCDVKSDKVWMFGGGTFGQDILNFRMLYYLKFI